MSETQPLSRRSSALARVVVQKKRCRRQRFPSEFGRAANGETDLGAALHLEPA